MQVGVVLHFQNLISEVHLITVPGHHTTALSSEGPVHLADADILHGAMIHSVTQEQFTVMAFMV